MSDFEEQPYWRGPYADNISTLLPRIKTFNEAIRKFAQNPDNVEDIKKAMEEYRKQFITEFNKTGVEEAPNLNTRENKKRENMARALDDLFDSKLIVDFLRMDFNVRLPDILNDTIGNVLIRRTGVYRRKNAKPEGYDFNYLDSDDIKDCLEELFENINQPIEPGRDDWYNVATDFFNRFQFAHPFKNGNNRVARILLSALLIHYSIVPVCFFLGRPESKTKYPEPLAEAHNPTTKNNKLLKSFIIEAVHDTLEHCIKRFNIQVD